MGLAMPRSSHRSETPQPPSHPLITAFISAGGEILLTDGVRAAYEEGKGGVQVRAKMHIEDGRWANGWAGGCAGIGWVVGGGQDGRGRASKGVRQPCELGKKCEISPPTRHAAACITPLPPLSRLQHHGGQAGQGQEVGGAGGQAAGGDHRAALPDQQGAQFCSCWAALAC